MKSNKDAFAPRPSGQSERVKRIVARGSQSGRFVEAAKALGCDESKEGFEATLRSIAKHKPGRATGTKK